MTTIIQNPKRPRKAPEYLIKEVLDGKPVYYKGYRTVMFGGKKVEDIMGVSSLQILIINYIQRILLKFLEEDLYFVFSGEPGLHLEHHTNLSGDLIVYKAEQLTKFDKHYFQSPPLLQIEVDVEIDNTNFTDNEYLTKKTQKLLDFGVQRVIWVLTPTQTVIVAEPDQDWRIINWNKDILLQDDIMMNIGTYLAKMNVELE
ncbi:Uma2 family endonuclease [Runella sp.]|uniref:Uma2 family endonuclease n=1 Tax=Runella sp. TaxID=1960881 RepID=UPI00261E3039|nr:Uma2 family endonuclease [Runella sp.]